MLLSERLVVAYKAEYEADRTGMALLIVHAIALAREAEYEADRAQNLVQVGASPVYPVWVRMLDQALEAEL